MYFLMRAPEKDINDLYRWSQHQICLLGGDVDTNGAIVGGVIGAYVGIDKIDTVQLQKLLESNALLNEEPRPKFL